MNPVEAKEMLKRLEDIAYFTHRTMHDTNKQVCKYCEEYGYDWDEEKK